MDDKKDRVTEAQLKKLVRKTLKKLLKSVESEPRTLVIESDNTRSDSSEQTAAEVRAFLFKGR